MSEKTTAIQERQGNITDEVLMRVHDLNSKGDLVIPPGYSAENALKSAWLILQETVDKDKKPALQVCSKTSVCNALLDMVIQGLSPSKKQCYFVVYGNKLQLMRSYMGTVAVTKRLKGITDVKAYVIYEGDEFEQEFNLDTMTLKITKFFPKFENIDISKVKGAFAVIMGEEGPLHIEVMNINQIKKAWGMNRTYSENSKVHNNFTDEMAKKSVINRACKMYFNTSDDSDILAEAFNNTDKELDTKELIQITDNEVRQEIEQKANVKEIDLTEDKQEETAKVIDVPENEVVQTTFEEPGF